MSGLPPGQYEIAELPRFGLPQFSHRFPRETRRAQLALGGDIERPLVVEAELGELPRVEQLSDLHCVTTWSRRALKWSGFRFADFYERVVVRHAKPARDAAFVVLRGQDGYRASMLLEDLLAPDVLLADRLNGEPLPLAYGAPLRLVAPAHYGYKQAKHLKSIEFRRDARSYRSAAFRFMEHPRARVALEERGRGLPGWLLRYLYRPMVRPTIRRFRRGLAAHLAQRQN